MTFMCEEVPHNTCAGDPHSAAEIVANIVEMWKTWRKFNFTEKSGARLCWKLLPRLRRLRRQVKIQLHIYINFCLSIHISFQGTMSLNNAEKVLFWHDNALKFKNLFT